MNKHLTLLLVMRDVLRSRAAMVAHTDPSSDHSQMSDLGYWDPKSDDSHMLELGYQDTLARPKVRRFPDVELWISGHSLPEV